MGAREWDYSVVQVIRVVDGDTYDLTLEKEMDFGFYLREKKRWSHRFRLLGVDTPERGEPGFAAATAFAEAWLAGAIGAGMLRAQTYKTDSFGRWLVDLYRIDTGSTLTRALIDAGLVEGP